MSPFFVSGDLFEVFEYNIELIRIQIVYKFLQKGVYCILTGVLAKDLQLQQTKNYTQLTTDKTPFPSTVYRYDSIYEVWLTARTSLVTILGISPGYLSSQRTHF